MQFGKFSLVLLIVTLFADLGAQVQERSYPYLGNTPTTEELKVWDTAVRPAGRELPPGNGTVQQGEEIYSQKCMGCHGQDLQGTVNGKPLLGGQGTLGTLTPKKTIGAYWPFATLIILA